MVQVSKDYFTPYLEDKGKKKFVMSFFATYFRGNRSYKVWS